MPLPAQSSRSLDLGAATVADGESLRYLRNIALVDSIGSRPPLRLPFTAAEERAWARVGQSASGPWQRHFSDSLAAASAPAFQWELLRADAQYYFRSGQPTTEAEGVVWAGRGSTVALQGGIRARFGKLRMQLAPVAFIAQNADFTLTPNGLTGARAYRDPVNPNNIDRPQRFGDGSYGRVDLGDSFIEASALGVSAALSTERQTWGPARVYPLVMSAGSGGFAHLRIGSSAPWDIKIGEVSWRLVTGKLEQSAFSPIDTGETSRFLSAVVGSFVPAFLPALELGATRLVNGPWPAEGASLSMLFRPIEGIINDNASDINQNSDNGFASIFMRLAPAGSGFEAYAEMSREDFAGNWRWLALEPDDLVHYTLGVARALRRGANLDVLRVELVNAEVSHTERAARTLRRPITPYSHSRTRQGLTNRGQLLGSSAAYGGAGGTIAWERYSPAGRTLIAAERELIRDWLPALGPTGGVPWSEIRYGVRVERLLFTRRGDATLTLVPSYTLNQRLIDGNDAWAVELRARWRGR